MRAKQRSPGTSLRLPEAIDQLWEDVSEKLHLPKSTVFILAIQDLARKNGVEERPVVAKEEEAEG